MRVKKACVHTKATLDIHESFLQDKGVKKRKPHKGKWKSKNGWNALKYRYY